MNDRPRDVQLTRLSHSPRLHASGHLDERRVTPVQFDFMYPYVASNLEEGPRIGSSPRAVLLGGCGTLHPLSINVAEDVFEVRANLTTGETRVLSADSLLLRSLGPEVFLGFNPMTDASAFLKAAQSFQNIVVDIGAAGISPSNLLGAVITYASAPAVFVTRWRCNVELNRVDSLAKELLVDVKRSSDIASSLVCDALTPTGQVQVVVALKDLLAQADPGAVRGVNVAPMSIVVVATSKLREARHGRSALVLRAKVEGVECMVASVVFVDQLS